MLKVFPGLKDSENNEALSVKPSSDPDTTINSSAVKFSANSSLKTSSRHDLAMIFTCKIISGGLANQEVLRIS
ncbi:hypothetical protein K1719_034771 [Acacia pycnantha]|nr:hypothetical protein K1719_034771 [Acacia pycnantha]